MELLNIPTGRCHGLFPYLFFAIAGSCKVDFQGFLALEFELELLCPARDPNEARAIASFVYLEPELLRGE